MYETTEKISNFISENFLYGEEGMKGNTSFIESGLIDSIGIMELVGFVEKTFELKVNDEELLPENFDTLDNLVMFVHRKRIGR